MPELMRAAGDGSYRRLIFLLLILYNPRTDPSQQASEGARMFYREV